MINQLLCVATIASLGRMEISGEKCRRILHLGTMEAKKFSNR
jgi:hypothetical protein